VTEEQWLACEDPEALLRHLIVIYKPGVVSERKLRLWVEACRAQAGIKHLEFDIDQPDGLRDAAFAYSRAESERLSFAARAALLRDFAGNPFRPSVVLPRDIGTVLDRGPKNYRQENGVLADWLTPTVLSLARAAYDERPGRACPECGGGGKAGWPGCVCKGTGRVKDGALDPVRLMVLADALEEAGCADPELLGHLRSRGPHFRGCWAVDLILGKE